MWILTALILVTTRAGVWSQATDRGDQLPLESNFQCGLRLASGDLTSDKSPMECSKAIGSILKFCLLFLRDKS